jgi:hypothetical protein
LTPHSDIAEMVNHGDAPYGIGVSGHGVKTPRADDASSVERPCGQCSEITADLASTWSCSVKATLSIFGGGWSAKQHTHAEGASSPPFLGQWHLRR